MNGPFPYSKLEEPNNELLSQEVVSYLKRDGNIVKVTVTRDFKGDDYTDSMVTEVIYAGV